MSGDVWTIIGVGVAILCIGGIVYRELRSDIRGLQDDVSGPPSVTCSIPLLDVTASNGIAERPEDRRRSGPARGRRLVHLGSG